MTSSFGSSYGTALAAYVGEPSERRLEAAYKLGRRAVEEGLGVLELAAVHTEALGRIARRSDDLLAVIRAAGDFLIESLASFEVVQRGATEAWGAAWEERRRARMVRELSAVLADRDVASAAGDSLTEVAQLVVETLRELIGAAEASAVFHDSRSGARVRTTTADVEEERTANALSRSDHPPERVAFTAPILSINGARRGQIEIFGPPGAQFQDDDRATAEQVADLVAAWLDRAYGSSF